jgi:hypothetical protein
MRKYLIVSLSAVLFAIITFPLHAQTGDAVAASRPDRVLTRTFEVRSESGTGTVNTIPKWVDTSGALADSAVSESGGLLKVGSTTQTGRLHLVGAATSDVFSGIGVDPSTGPSFNFGYGGFSFGRSTGFFNVRPDSLAEGPNPSLRFATADTVRMIITKDGKVGIGYGIGSGTSTTTPAEKLDVIGNIHATGSITADGALYAKFQDIAEWVPASGDLAPGTVVILNHEKNNEVMASATAYDTSVAGVVSAQPGLSLGVRREGREQVATTGRVNVRVSAARGAIGIGDLLVTSDTPGTAMRSEPMIINGRKFHQPGTIIGKALEPLAAGEGEILVLLSLQ